MMGGFRAGTREPFTTARATAGGFANELLGAGGPQDILSALAAGIPTSGYTPEQQSALLDSTLGAINRQYDSARRRVQDIAGRTGAYGSLIPSTLDLVQRQGSDLGEEGGKLAQYFAEFPTKQRLAAGKLTQDQAENLLGLYRPQVGLAGEALHPLEIPSLGTQLLAGAGGSAIDSILQALLSGSGGRGGVLGKIGSIFGGGSKNGGQPSSGDNTDAILNTLGISNTFPGSGVDLGASGMTF